MTSRTRNLSILGLVAGLLVLAALVIVPGSPLSKETVLGLDLRGGVELVYEGRKATPQSPEVTPENLDDAVETIRKRTDSLGVSEPEIQRAGQNQISIGLPDVQNTDRAVEQVGTTAQLQFYDWEPNVLGDRGPDAPFAGSKGLFQAVELASKSKPRPEATDLPPDGAAPEVQRRFGDDTKAIQRFYDERNDSAPAKYYLFGEDQRLIAGPDSSCQELLADFEAVEGPPRASGQIPEDSECRDELAGIPVGDADEDSVNSTSQDSGPPAGSRVLQVPQGIVVVQAERAPDVPDTVPTSHFVLEDDSELSGSDIENPEQSTDAQTNEQIVTMDFTGAGREAFATVTKRIAQRGAEIILPPGATADQREAALQRFAITLDNEIISLATIDFRENPEGIDGRTGAQINGIGNPEETRQLAEQLRIGALPIELKLISQTSVSATLGAQALDQGLLAGGAGLMLTILFLLLFYRVLGAVAAGALVIYALLLFALVKVIPITLTLPGIAGMVLTLAVAADANIVVFERIKEEVRAGRSIPASIAGGYSKALRTIIDANVVTIGVAFILFTLATAGVKGFAFTMGIGTIVSVFTAVLAVSAILGVMARTRLVGSRLSVGVGKREAGWRFDFIGRSRWFFSASGLILVTGALAIAGLGINFGIDFESGTRIKTPVEREASVGEIRDTLAPLGYGNAKVQDVEEPDLGANVFQIATSTLEPTEVEQVREALDEDFGVAQGDFSSSSIGPTFGAQIARTALIAVVASLLLLSLYIGLRFEPKFTVPVLIGITHDILIVSGVYALLGREVTTSTVAALLTILGYSLYDTIIVFDRIRENVPRMPRATFSQIVNRSMSEVFTRSLATSLSTLFPIAALMLFGGETLRDFGLALLVGVASGAYSSIFIAAPVLTLWKEREPVYVRRRKLVMADHGGRVPAFATGRIGDGATPEVQDAQAAPRRSRAASRLSPRSAASAPPEGPGVPAAPDGPATPARPESPAAPESGSGESRPASRTATAVEPPAGGNGAGDGDGEGDGDRSTKRSSVSSTGGSRAGSAKPKRSAGGRRGSKSRKKHGRGGGR